MTTQTGFDPGDQGHGQIERRIGQHIADFVEHSAERTLHAVLARQHAVDGG